MKSELDFLADRHLRPDPQGVLDEQAATKTGVVLVQVSEPMAAALGVQHLVWMLVNLLSRQFKVVDEVVLDVPATVPVQPGVAAFGVKATLLETLEECVRLVSGPHIKVARAGLGTQHDVALLIGNGTPVAPWHWRLYADGWRYFVGLDGEVPATPPQSGLSIGPYLCASYAAGEVFKLFRGMKPGKGEFVRALFTSAWTVSNADSWAELGDGPAAAEFGLLPHFYFAGAGAVAQAAALCLGSSGFKGSCSAVDKDDLDLTNDNRYALSTRDDDGASKAQMLQAYLQTHGFECRALPEWWETFAASGGKFAPNPEMRTLERGFKFPIVLSCVDKNKPRHALQNALPQLLIGGSTDGLTAKASIFDLGAGTACLKCHNPLQSRNTVIQARRASLQMLEGEARLAYARELGLTEADVELLLSAGGCGKLSEGDLERFSAGTPEMSVGFVSITAGVLLVVQLLRYLQLGAADATQDGAMAVATFARARVRPLQVGNDQSCDCEPLLRVRWKGIWSSSYRR
ncbi:ThiF family adenylyltransferase [Roseateles sp. 22389]|uniref:ThiF family adenylyltransferase n=1 Tax=Roseateles sp. 22389 TaxID=3453916 RepID=UPI003F8622AE